MQQQQNKALKHNNFDLLRTLFAMIVFVVHACTLTGELSLRALASFLSTQIAVQSFFVISGFLIFMSYENSAKLTDYFSKRLRRIYPAYFSVVVLCAVFGVFFSVLSFDSYFSVAWLKYLIANLAFLNFLQPNLPGLFSENINTAVNGALWTLKIEVMFYLSVPIIVWGLRKFGLWQGLLLLYCLSLAHWMIFGVLAQENGGFYVELQRQLPGQLMYFIAGGAMYYYFDWFKKYVLWLLAFAFLVLYFREYDLSQMFHAFAIAVVVVYFATVFKYLGNFGKFGDFSYGVYIWHFPIIQVLVQYGVFKVGPWFGFGVTFILVFVFSALSWHLIEKPFLRRTSHYVKANL